MAKHFIIYETKNLKNGKIYIGAHSTNDLNDGYLGSGFHFKRAMRYYGKEFFERKILFSFENEEDMYSKEAELVNADFIKRDDVYNMTLGGKSGNFVHDLEKHKEISTKGRIATNKIIQKRLKEDSEYRAYFNKRISEGVNDYFKNGGKNGFDGKTHTEKSKEKMRLAHKGKQKGCKNGNYDTCWIYNEHLKQSKQIKNNELQQYFKAGWLKGRKMKF